MSFNLPRNQKDLRFTGELRAAIDDHPKSRLGVPRSKKRPETVPTPFAPPPIDFFEHDDDDAPTTMLDRDGLDILAGGFAAVGASRPSPDASGGNPVPNFRMPAPTPKVIVAPHSVSRMRPRGQDEKTPPLLFWLVAALVLAIVSYKITPVAFAKAENAAKRVQTM
jgi:hypothetical protein